jgi:hypothetical protein
MNGAELQPCIQSSQTILFNIDTVCSEISSNTSLKERQGTECQTETRLKTPLVPQTRSPTIAALVAEAVLHQNLQMHPYRLFVLTVILFALASTDASGQSDYYTDGRVKCPRHSLACRRKNK